MVPSLIGLPLLLYDNFKISPQPICSSKSYKYNKYDQMTYRVSPYCCIPQENLISRLFTILQLTLHHYPGAASLINHCVWYLFDLKITSSLGLRQEPSNSECSTLTYFSVSLDIKEQIATQNYLRKKTGFTWNPYPRGIVCKGCFSNSIPFL